MNYLSKGCTLNRERFFELLNHLSPIDREKVVVAYWLAKNAQRGQTRDGGERYFEHVRGVALLLIENGYSDAEIIIKALLHDLIEDTETPFSIIIMLFGKEVFESLLLLSKNEPVFDESGTVIRRIKLSDEVYYGNLVGAAQSDRLVKCADRLHNLLSMGVWPRLRQIPYAIHTEKFALPLAMETDETFYTLLKFQVELVLQRKVR